MNYHFTTTKSHIVLNGGRVEEVFKDEALKLQVTIHSKEIWILQN